MTKRRIFARQVAQLKQLTAEQLAATTGGAIHQSVSICYVGHGKSQPDDSDDA